ncbi:hypothetical protein [Actinoplanes sp. NPDC023714]|uniref:hypothetical protein n=1 Tax=Actinoplanes sp. NPDC023714 TaxID=3154322 RepID=UPI0033C5EEEF
MTTLEETRKSPMLPAAVVSTLAALLVLLPSPGELGSLAVASAGNQVTLIGVIIVLGAAVGEVMRRTRVADVIVRACVGLVDGRGPVVTSFGRSRRSPAPTWRSCRQPAPDTRNT